MHGTDERTIPGLPSKLYTRFAGETFFLNAFGVNQSFWYMFPFLLIGNALAVQKGTPYKGLQA
jgi:hypothetical protein